MNMPLHSCRVVLVRPQTASNIGAVARAMKTMGLRDLVLVSPEADPTDERAALLATAHARDVLQSARIVRDLGEALADCRTTAATSALVAGLYRRHSFGTPEEIAPLLLRELPFGPVALVFGPEASGLSNEEVARCHHLIHIPADPEYPVLNLAQAVMVCLYEFRRIWLRQEAAPVRAEPPAPYADQERMFEHLRLALEEIHYLYGPKADALMHGLRRLLGRAGPTLQEVRFLHGLARQLRWIVREKGDKPSPY